MKPDIRPAQPDEQAVHSPELMRLVELARAQPLPPTRQSADALHAAFLAARGAQRRRLGALAGLAVAAALAALALARLDLGLSQGTGPTGHVAEHMAPGTAPLQPLGPVLAAGVRVVAASDDTPSPTVLGGWEVGLAPGRYTVEVDEHPGPELLRARASGGTVELHHGRVQVVVGAARTEVALQHGVGTWVAKDGARSALRPASAADPDPTATPPAAAASDAADPDPTAAPPAAAADRDADATNPARDPAVDVNALARRAEALLTDGKREAAIKLLTQIVSAHAQHPAARGALLDLGPLLRAAGRVDEARCAYRLYLERYPGKPQLADQVAKALARLGDGPDCRGLKPR